MTTLQSLSRTECWTLLAGHRVGRLVFSERALPAIRPLNYAVVGRHILLRTYSRTLASHVDGQVIAFEVDDLDLDGRSGWSVVATGTARHVREPGELARLHAVPLVSWAEGATCELLVLTIGQLTGRVIGGSDRLITDTAS